MKPFLLTAKITFLFALAMGLVLLATLLLFMRVAGHNVIDELGILRAYRGMAVAKELEEIWQEAEAPNTWQELARDPRVLARIEKAEDGLPVAVSLQAPGEAPGDRHTSHWGKVFLHNRPVEIGGRDCSLLGPPSFGTLVPVYRDGRQAAQILVLPHRHWAILHRAFARGLLWIGGLGLASIVSLAFFIAAPHRRMSKAMDRIAAGDLAHRVTVKGRDEVAAMGRSFNCMADRIQEMITRQKELSAGVSHELRSPLTRMKLSLELLREAQGEHPKIDGLEGDIDLLNGLVEELLLASRIELGSTPLELQRLDLEDLAREAWRRVEEEAAAKSMPLVLDLGQGAQAVLADRALLLRLLGNLFENSVRYAKGEIKLCATAKDGRISLRVSDQGPGVKVEHLDRLFEPFYRADPSRSRRTGASGLGLMIAKRAVEAHGGNIRAENREKGGLSIQFDLASP